MTPTENSNSATNETTILLKTDSRGRIKLPKERREALLDEFERSGMSGQEFAKWAGVKYSTFAFWRQQRRRELGVVREGEKQAKPVAINLVEAVLPETVVGDARKGSITIHMRGEMRVECGSAAEAAEFVRLLGGVAC